ncbi:MAG: FAD-dependent oxidoreductase, partial [Clostridiales bacterium]
MEKIRLNINGKEVAGYRGQTILAVAQENGIQIPTLCFDQRMETYGSCGICVVEAEGSHKLLRSCATEIAEGMVIKTDTQRVRESRKTNLELLLSNHVGDCRPPCVLACPAHTDCQGYVGLIANGENAEALKLIKEQIPLPASIGRVCPHPCETACRRKLVEEPISILNLKRYAADIDLASAAPYLPDCAAESGYRIAVVGGGPGGLSAAYYLAIAGHSVTIFDAMPKMGGMLRYGIPEYRLPKEVLDQEIALIAAMGVTMQNKVKIGRDITIASLREDFDAVLVAIGAWTSSGMRCPGEDLPGVYGGIHFLRQIVANEPVTIGKKVAVVGGGNTAMDACRTAIRLGAEQVYTIYRRTKDEMPAEKIEIEEAEQEGVIFKYLVNPLEIIAGKDGRVKKIKLQQMSLGEPDASGRRRPVPIEGAEEILDVDTVIAAIGQGIDPNGIDGVAQTKWHTIAADVNTFVTDQPGVFAIGDCVNKGASIAIEAIADAKKAAHSIDLYLNGQEIVYIAPYVVERDDLSEADFADRKKEHRSHPEHTSPEERKDNFVEFNQGFTAEQAKNDAARCLECGCHDYFECKLIDMANQYRVEPARFQESVLKHEFRDDHPFILRDPNKCILCSLCVRVCADMIGSEALGLVDRGFHTVVLPALGDSLAQTSCLSCGECISVCPTGALGERAIGKKSVPLLTDKTESVCGMCSLGCAVTLESKGKLLIKAVPGKNGINQGVMC